MRAEFDAVVRRMTIRFGAMLVIFTGVLSAVKFFA